MSSPRWRRHYRLGVVGQREQANGLPDDWWVPVFMVDTRIVPGLLEELHRTGVPACCARFVPRRPFARCWCLWAGGSACERAGERLAEVLPLLARSPRRPWCNDPASWPENPPEERGRT